jgi:type VI secretion system secreted protein VgrG
MHRSEEFFFAWDGAGGPAGPFSHLLVVEATGVEAMSRPYAYTIDLVVAEGAPDVALGDLVGRLATLKVRTRIDPAVRRIHGVVSEAEQLGDVHGRSRFRVRLTPPFTLARMMRRCRVFVDRTLADVLDETLTRADRKGMALELSKAEPATPDGDSDDWQAPVATYVWRVTDVSRLYDLRARPYCVQYEESDVAFVERLLEEEGIAYHFEHTATECVLVLSDNDGARDFLAEDLVLAPEALNREVRDLRVGGRLRPLAYGLMDYDWRKPDLWLAAVGGDQAEDTRGTLEQPGRFEHSPELGQKLADVRFGELETERTFGSFKTACRALGAGLLFTIEHPKVPFAGMYLAQQLRVTMRQPAHFGTVQDGEPSYEAHVDVVLSKPTDEGRSESAFRPGRMTPRPRITGSQTAVVTSEPGVEQEINVGGDADVGCVRLRFHWDVARGPDDRTPTSCWVRVSQMFAGGRGHGAMFHPRVGDEVIVEYLEGDPDRPIVTGRVYNGRNLSPENATNRPTYSCIKSMTSPYDGNFNMIAFDDLQGEEKFIVHVARDYISNIRHDSSRFVANFDKIEVKGDQLTIIHGAQTTAMNNGQHVTILGSQDYTITVNQTLLVGNLRMTTIGGTDLEIVNGSDITVSAVMIAEQAPLISSVATTISLTGKSDLHAKAPTLTIDGNIVSIHGAVVMISGDSTVNINGGSVNLNC